MLLSLLKSLNSHFSREGGKIKEEVVGGKMNSDNFGRKIRVASSGSLNNIFRGILIFEHKRRDPGHQFFFRYFLN